MTKYSRVVLKLSGEALAGGESKPLNFGTLQFVADEISSIIDLGVKVSLVIGAGNLFRGDDLIGEKSQVKRVTADQVGMLGTVINALVLRDVLESAGMRARIFTPRGIGGVSDTFSRDNAKTAYDEGDIVLCAGGTGNPLFTTDTAASLRAIELEADVVLKATQVDGVYDSDPLRDATATRFASLSFDQVIKSDLRVMDLAAFAMCRDHNMPIVVYKLTHAGALTRIVSGSEEGTLVSAESQD